jgi:hypothetical protein
MATALFLTRSFIIGNRFLQVVNGRNFEENLLFYFILPPAFRSGGRLGRFIGSFFYVRRLGIGNGESKSGGAGDRESL